MKISMEQWEIISHVVGMLGFVLAVILGIHELSKSRGRFTIPHANVGFFPRASSDLAIVSFSVVNRSAKPLNISELYIRYHYFFKRHICEIYFNCQDPGYPIARIETFLREINYSKASVSELPDTIGPYEMKWFTFAFRGRDIERCRFKMKRAVLRGRFSITAYTNFGIKNVRIRKFRAN